MHTKEIQKEIRKKRIIVITSIILIFILQLQNVDALMLAKDNYAINNFVPNEYSVIELSGNYTICRFTPYIFPAEDILTSYVEFMLNISYNDLDSEVGFSYIPYSINIFATNVHPRVSLGWYQSSYNIYITTIGNDLVYMRNWYMAGSLFEESLSFNPLYIGLVGSQYNFTRVSNNLYSTKLRFTLSEFNNLIIQGNPYFQAYIDVYLLKDYSGNYTLPIDSLNVPIYDSSTTHTTPSGNVWDRFIENASKIALLIVIPLYFVWKIENNKLLPFLMIVMLIICFALAYIDLLQMILGLLIAILMLIKSDNEGGNIE